MRGFAISFRRLAGISLRERPLVFLRRIYGWWHRTGCWTVRFSTVATVFAG